PLRLRHRAYAGRGGRTRDRRRPLLSCLTPGAPYGRGAVRGAVPPTAGHRGHGRAGEAALELHPWHQAAAGGVQAGLMTIATLPKRLGFFTRLLDQADPAERYRLATAQIIHAERFGFDSAWIAQHHFHEDEGGLPAPFVFLAQVAAQTSRIRLGTAVVTLPLELPIRAAEDSAVLDLMCGGRLEVGVGGGGNLSSYATFGQDSA